MEVHRLVRRVLISTFQRTRIIFDSEREHKSLAAACGRSAYTHLACSTWDLKSIFIMKRARPRTDIHRAISAGERSTTKYLAIVIEIIAVYRGQHFVC